MQGQTQHLEAEDLGKVVGARHSIFGNLESLGPLPALPGGIKPILQPIGRGRASINELFNSNSLYFLKFLGCQESR